MSKQIIELMSALQRYGQWLYVCLILVAGYGHLLRKLIADSGGFSSRLSPALAVTIVAVGLIAYRYERAILRRWFWQAILWVLVFASTLSIVFVAYYGIFGGVFALWQGIVIAVVLLLLPAELQLYGYAYVSTVWQQDEAAGE